MIFEEPREIAINLATAQSVDYDPPLEILSMADKIYDEIKVMEK